MSTRKVVPYEGSDFDEDLQAQLTNPEFASSYINSVIDNQNADYFIIALSRIVKAYGFASVAQKSGIGREALYKMLSENGNPSFVNVVKILNACGLIYYLRPAGRPALEPVILSYPGKVADLVKSAKLSNRVEEASKPYQITKGTLSKTTGRKKIDEYMAAKKSTKKTTKKVAAKKVATKKISTKKQSAWN